MTDKEWNQSLITCLKGIYEFKLDLLSESEYTKWMDFLQTESVMQSSTTQDEFVEFLKEFGNRLTKEIDNIFANRAELAEILHDANIDTGIR